MNCQVLRFADQVSWVEANLMPVRPSRRAIIAALASNNALWAAAQMPTNLGLGVLPTDSPEPKDLHG